MRQKLPSHFGSRVSCLLAFTALLVVPACSAFNTPHQNTDSADSGIVVLGAVTATGLKVPVDMTKISIDLAALLAARASQEVTDGGVSRGSNEEADRANVKVTSAQLAREIIGAGPHDEMLAYYARHARLEPYQIQRLMAANLPASRALVVRLVSDKVERLPMQRKALLDASGVQVADRERHMFITQRSTRLSAMLLNLSNGRVEWTRLYRVNPVTQISVNHYIGKSITSGLAATVTDTVVRGFGDVRYPSPPSLTESVLALLQEVVYQLPLHKRNCAGEAKLIRTDLRLCNMVVY